MMRIALADDQMLFVDSLKTVLEYSTDDIEICGVAMDGQEAVDLVASEHPEVILMDVRMPEMDGVEATRIIRKEHPKTHVVMLTTFDDDEYVFSALSYGALGYLLKNIPSDELVASLRAIRSGTMQISPRVAKKLIERGPMPPESVAATEGYEIAGGGALRDGPEESSGERPGDGPAGGTRGTISPSPGAGSSDRSGAAVSPGSGDPGEQREGGSAWLERLSEREWEVLRLLGKGWHNKEIADQLAITEQTVKNHLSAVYHKMGVNSRLEAFRRLSESDVEL
jgi:DNA-binding NarL/FixJ family response regulator